MMKARIAVIGGGVTGAFAAYFLSRLGAQATIIERDWIAAHASGHNSGGLNPLQGAGIPGPMQELALQSLRLHREHWDLIAQLSGGDFGARLVPRLLVAMDDGDAHALAARLDLIGSTPGFSARWVPAEELHRTEPRLSAQALGGLWTEGNARVDPGPYTRAVAAAAASLGATAVNAEVRGLRHHAGRVSDVELDSGTLACDGVVLAPGPWCEQLVEWLGISLPVEPLKGELLLATADGSAPDAEIGWGKLGVYRASEEGMWLGGTEERAGFDEAPTLAARTRILDGVARLLPGLGTLRVQRHVAALRPVTPDGRPIVGLAAGWDNVCVATGAGRKGMLYGAGLGLAAAELLMKSETSLSIGPCAPDRWRSM